MRTTICTAKASYKKAPGLLELTETHLEWTQDGKKTPSVRVPYAEAASLFCSKEGAAQVKLKLGLVGDDTGHNFTFTSPQAVAYSERERFKKELTNIISRNRSVVTNTPRPPITAAPLTPASSAFTSRPASVASEMRPPVPPGNDSTSEFRLRKKVLMSNPELGILHRELVMSGQITEAEFWDGREHLILEQAAAESQRKGKLGQLVDPRPETVEGGAIKIRITPQLVHDIFDEYPVVAKAYSDNVPNKLSEEEFWKRYFQSKLFNAHRASIRSSATQHVVKDDPIFDRYLEKEDDELEPRRRRDDIVVTSVDLAATQEDHVETGNEKDVTMQPGKQRGALPLIRKFNEHSERLLNLALGEGPPAKRRRIDGDGHDESYSEIDLDDLHDPEAPPDIILEMQDRQRYFEGQMSSIVSAEEIARMHIDAHAMLREAKESLEQWDENLGQLRIDRKAGDTALLSMTHNVASRLDVKTRKNHIPEDLFRQMTTCQTAANEFLRQFWSCIYPPPTDAQTLSVAGPAQKAAKAAKMIGYLSKTQEKVDALLRVARLQGVDPASVESGMRPVLNAVEQALDFYKTKKAPRA